MSWTIAIETDEMEGSTKIESIVAMTSNRICDHEAENCLS